MATIPDQKLEWLVSSMAEQLAIAYPNGPMRDDNNCTFDEDQIKDLVGQLSCPDDIEDFKVAFPTAVQQWKSSSIPNLTVDGANSTGATPESFAKTSFSLFDQLQGGFAPPFTVEDIEETESAEERLRLLEKVTFLDDLVMDWGVIGPMLKQDLLSSSSATILDITALYRKWYDQGRSSNEYEPLLYSLCQTLLETLVDMMSDPTCDFTDDDHDDRSRLVVSLVQTWRDMFLDLMQRDQYCEDLVEEMEVCMLVLFLRSVACRNHSTSTTTSSIAQEDLAMIDTESRWFQSWIDHISSTERLTQILYTTTYVLPDLWRRTQAFPTTTSPSTFALELQAISILAATLSRTRVSQFPWGSLTNASTVTSININDLRNWKKFVDEQQPHDVPASSPSTESSTTSRSPSPPSSSPKDGPDYAEKDMSKGINPELVDKMLDLFLEATAFLPIHDARDARGQSGVLFQGIEAVLSGCRAGNLDYDRLCRKVASTIGSLAAAGDTSAARFLEAHSLQ